MRMTQISFKKGAFLLSVFTFLGITTVSFAQYNQTTLPWPKTFVGEPDFDYLRNEVIDEYKRKKGQELSKYVSTLDILLNAKEVDPFIPRPRTSDIGRSKYSQDIFERRFTEQKKQRAFSEVYPDIEIGTGLEVHMRSGTVIQAKLISATQAQSLKEKDLVFDIAVAEDGLVVESIKEKSISELFNNLLEEETPSEETAGKQTIDLQKIPSSFNVNNLPEIDKVPEEVKENLTEFALFLDNIIKQAERSKEADLESLDLRPYLKKLILQSVSISPSKYVIINNVRFTEGDRIPLRVAYHQESEDTIENVIETYMPSKTGLPEDVYQKYVQLKETAIKSYKDKKKALMVEDNKEEQTHIISVKIKKIESRKVIFEILGKDYPLEVKFSL